MLSRFAAFYRVDHILILAGFLGLSSLVLQGQEAPGKRPGFAVPAAVHVNGVKHARETAGTDPGRALPLFEAELRSHPDAWTLRRETALLCERLGRWEDATRHWDAINGASGTEESWGALCRNQARGGQTGSAAATAVEALRLFPTNKALKRIAAEAFVDLGLGVRALPLLRDLLADDEAALPDLRLLQARALEQAGDSARALAAFRGVLATDAANAAAKAGLARIAEKAIVLGRCWFLPPAGWVPVLQGVVREADGLAVSWTIGGTGTAAARARSVAAGPLDQQAYAASVQPGTEEAVRRVVEHARDKHGEALTENQAGKLVTPGPGPPRMAVEAVDVPLRGALAHAAAWPGGSLPLVRPLSRLALAVEQGQEKVTFVVDVEPGGDLAATKAALRGLAANLVPALNTEALR